MRKPNLQVITAIAAAIVVASCAAAKPGPHPTLAELNQPVTASYAETAPAYDGKLQVIAFNIERGIYWKDTLRYLQAAQAKYPATLLLLSELDRNHSRSGDVFVADELARALKMNMAFITEYREFNDRTPETPGDHGNAILSPFPLSEVVAIRHSSVFSWQRWGWLQGQPRIGERVTVAATVTLPDGKKIRAYSCHFESNGDSLRRSRQMAEVVADLQRTSLPAVIGGDFNELPGGVIFMRLSGWGLMNAFAGDNSPTGGCKPGEGRAKCLLKIDWILSRGMKLLDRGVDYPLNSEGGVISDHAPVRARFEIN